jgi:hypothetical protein
MNIRLVLTLALLVPFAAQAETPTLHVFGSRTARQLASPVGAKLDPALAELSSHLGRVNSASALGDLHSLSPAARFMQRASDPTPLVLVDAVTRGDVQQLRKALVALGLQRASTYSNVVSGWLPVNQIEAATARAELHSMNASLFRTRAGAITTQGDFAQHTAALRSTYSSLDGTGVTVGALSDSYDCYAQFAQNHVPASGYAGYAPNGFLATASTDVSTGDLPSGVNVVAEAPCMNGNTYAGAPTQLPFADEGRAILQIIHDVAPGASLAFYTAENGEADFANGITTLASTAHAKVIVDDVGYFDEPYFQDGLIAQAIDGVYAQGVAYFSSAGNDAQNSYENTAPAFITLSTTSPNSGEYLLNFDNSGTTNVTSLPINIPSLQPGWLIALVLQWDQPYVKGASGSPGATSHMDLCVTGAGGDTIINLSGNTVTCTGPNSTGSDPVQILIVSNPANAAGPSPATTINVFVGLAGGTAAPGRIKLGIEDDGIGAAVLSSSAAYAYSKNPTVQGHPGANGAAAVGAAAFYKTPACGIAPAVLETFSSVGGTPILFDKSGARLATPTPRQKPNFVAPDRGNNTFFGHILSSTADQSTVSQCADNQSYPNFAGTSAAAPHAAAAAALMLQANSTLTAPQIYTALQKTALAMGNTPPDYASGYGFIQADVALAALPPAAPALTFSNSSVVAGTTTTLTWTSINTTGCTASGGWTGSQSTNGSTTITAPSTTGTTDYTLTCSNANGSASATAPLQVQALPAPTLKFSSSSVTPGATTTLTWTSTDATGCVASGGWTGSQVTNGSTTITAPSTAGTTDYTLTCSNANGSASATATLTVTAQSSGGGGGAVDQLILWVLAGALIVARRPWAPAPQRFPQSCRAMPAGQSRLRSTGTRGPQRPATGNN